jgi:hypothetical protein
MKFWNSLVAQEVAAVVSALVLAIGAVIEYWSKIKLLTLLALKWILRRSTPFDRCTFCRLLFHSVGPILVVLGIAGEFVFEGRTFVLGYRQEQQAENTVAALKEKASANEKDAAELRKQAAELKKESVSVELDVANAKKDAARAIERAAKAEENLGNAQKSAAEAKRDAEQERLERVKLAAIVQPRLLSLKTQKDLAEACKPFAGYTAEIYSYVGDPEIAGLQATLIAGLKGIKIEGHSAIAMNGPPPERGIIVVGDSGLVKAIDDALNTEHIKHDAKGITTMGKRVMVRIGTKPFDVLP